MNTKKFTMESTFKIKENNYKNYSNDDFFLFSISCKLPVSFAA